MLLCCDLPVCKFWARARDYHWGSKLCEVLNSHKHAAHPNLQMKQQISNEVLVSKIMQHWFRWWIGVKQMTSHYLHQLIYTNHTVSPGHHQPRSVLVLMQDNWILAIYLLWGRISATCPISELRRDGKLKIYTILFNFNLNRPRSTEVDDEEKKCKQ